MEAVREVSRGLAQETIRRQMVASVERSLIELRERLKTCADEGPDGPPMKISPSEAMLLYRVLTGK